MLCRVLSVALAHERWESFVLFVHEKPLQNTYPNISKAISLWYIQAGIYPIKDPRYCHNTVELGRGKARADGCIHTVLDSISDDRRTCAGLSLRVRPVAPGEKAASCSAESQGGGPGKRPMLGRPCRFTSKVCSENREAFYSSSVFSLAGKKSKREKDREIERDSLYCFDKSLKVLKWKCLCKRKIL